MKVSFKDASHMFISNELTKNTGASHNYASMQVSSIQQNISLFISLKKTAVNKLLLPLVDRTYYCKN